MYLLLYVCMYVCIYVCMHAYMHLLLYLCMCVCIHICMHVCTSACVYAVLAQRCLGGSTNRSGLLYSIYTYNQIHALCIYRIHTHAQLVLLCSSACSHTGNTHRQPRTHTCSLLGIDIQHIEKTTHAHQFFTRYFI